MGVLTVVIWTVRMGRMMNGRLGLANESTLCCGRGFTPRQGYRSCKPSGRKAPPTLGSAPATPTTAGLIEGRTAAPPFDAGGGVRMLLPHERHASCSQNSLRMD